MAFSKAAILVLIFIASELRTTEEFLKNESDFIYSNLFDLNKENCLKLDENVGEKTTTVSVKGLGDILGIIETTSRTKRKFRSFRGIPYGRIPRRFQPATLIERLNTYGEHFDGTMKQFACVQPPMEPFIQQTEIHEDCLTLNVYTPLMSRNVKRLLPIIVFIHGGSFFRWSGSMFNGKRILEEDVILVTINYRLNIFSFFNLEIDMAPGNLALYDQILALQWVKKYIEEFGGDSNKVTIAGQSAGGAAVTYLMESALANGLFHQVISASGDSGAAWAVEKDPLGNSLRAATHLKCANGTDTPQDLNVVIQCMRLLPANKILDALPVFFSAPSIQSYDLHHTRKVLGEKNLVSRKKIPMLIGVNRNDGSFLMSRVYTQHLKAKGLQDDENYVQNQFLRDLLSSPHFGITKKNFNTTIDGIAKLYFQVGASNQEQLQGFVDIFSAFYFQRPACRRAYLHSQKGGKAFLYSLDYDGLQSLYPLTGGIGEIAKGVGHGDDLMYLFHFEEFATEEEQLVSDNLIRAWVNFALTGDPNVGGEAGPLNEVSWSHFTKQNSMYQSIHVRNKIIYVHDDVANEYLSCFHPTNEIKIS